MKIDVRIGIVWSIGKFDVESSDTIYSIKEKIWLKYIKPVCSLTLIYRGIGWNDYQTVSELNIIFINNCIHQ